MPKKVIASFNVEYLQVMDDEGNVDNALMPQVSQDDIKKFFAQMLLMRAFDKKCLALQRQGRLGTYAYVTGQEATQVGTANLLSKDDWMFPTYRESGSYLIRGMPMHTLLLYWAGDERGQHIPEGENDFTIAIPIASQIPHAVGAAWGLKLQGKKNASMVYFGDGSTSKGDFHESINFAGVFKLPVIFVCSNNYYAISLARNKQTAAETLAQKGIAYGVPCLQVDGNDVFAVYAATKEALDRAYRGEGPTLLELMTYRITDHTTSDDASRYRSKEEVEQWKKKDPIDRLRKYMQKNSLWSEEFEKQVQSDSEHQIEEAVKKLEATPPQEIEDIFKYVYSEMPMQLKEQLEYAKKFPLEKKE